MLRIINFSGMNGTVHLLVLFTLLLALFSPSAWCQEQKGIDEKLESGRVLFEAGELHRAAKLFEEVIASQPAHESARSMLFTCYRFMGIEYYGLSRYTDAIDVWRKALKINPQSKEIQSFITRSESEMKAMARISGEVSLVEEKPPSSSISSPVHIDSDSLVQSSVVDSEAIWAEEPVIKTSRGAIKFGLSSGLAIATGRSRTPKTGRVFSGYLSYLPDRHWLGARLEGIHSRFYGNSAGDASAPRHLAVSGLSMSAIISAEVSRSTSIDFGVGLGYYEIILTDPNDDQYSSSTRKSSVLGVNLGLSGRRNIGAITATVYAGYIHPYSSLDPNLLQISIGISSN